MNLKHFALYSKGHYLKSKNIWEDITKCLEADGYTPMTNHDCVEIIVNNISPIIILNYGHGDMRTLLNGISPKECWRHGYYTKDHMFTDSKVEYDFETAILYYFMSIVRFLTIEQCCGLPKANKKVLPVKVNKKKYRKENMYK